MSLGTASMCISKWVYETPANVRVGYLFISTKSIGVPFGLHQCVLVIPLFCVSGLHFGVLVLGNPSGIRVVDRRLS